MGNSHFWEDKRPVGGTGVPELSALQQSAADSLLSDQSTGTAVWSLPL